jgi:hypothetical protein
MAEEVLKARRDARRRHYVAACPRRTPVPKACGALHALFSSASERRHTHFSRRAAVRRTNFTRTTSASSAARHCAFATFVNSTASGVLKPGAAMLDREEARSKNPHQRAKPPSRGCGVALVWSRRPMRRLLLSNQASFPFVAQTRVPVVPTSSRLCFETFSRLASPPTTTALATASP